MSHLHDLVSEMAQRAEKEHEKEIRDDEARKCCADICSWCRSDSVPKRGHLGRWYHTEKATCCHASAIHERIFREKSRKEPS